MFLLKFANGIAGEMTCTFGIAHEEGRRITRVLSYVRDEPTDNGYAKPIEGLVVIVDRIRRTVTVPQFGIFAQGTIAHAFLEWDLRADVDLHEVAYVFGRLRGATVARKPLRSCTRSPVPHTRASS